MGPYLSCGFVVKHAVVDGWVLFKVVKVQVVIQLQNLNQAKHNFFLQEIIKIYSVKPLVQLGAFPGVWQSPLWLESSPSSCLHTRSTWHWGGPCFSNNAEKVSIVDVSAITQKKNHIMANLQMVPIASIHGLIFQEHLEKSTEITGETMEWNQGLMVVCRDTTILDLNSNAEIS